MRAFSDKEKEAIRAKLIKAAERLFTEQGFSKTSVSELARAAGIGKGTFYMFYKTKEELVCDLHSAIHQQWEHRFTGVLACMVDDPEQAIVQFLHAAFEIFSHPLVLKLQQTGDFDRIYRSLEHSELDAHSDMSLEPMVPLVGMAQQAGAIIEGNPRVIAATIRSVCMLGLHRQDIGAEMYDEVIELLIALVAKGLTKEREKND